MTLVKEAELDFKDNRPDDEVVTVYESTKEYLTRVITPFKRQIKPTLQTTTVSYMRMFENANKSNNASKEHPSDD